MALTPSVFLSTSHDPYVNLAAEEWFFHHREPEHAVLFFCRNLPTVIIGRNQNPWRECDVEALPSLGVRLARRMSGGGTVYHDLGNLNFSFILPRTATELDTVPELVARALAQLGIRPVVTPRRGLEVAGRKISGTAFWLTSRNLLYHGTLLVASDLERVARCLYVQTPGFATHAVTSVRSPVVNLCDLVPQITMKKTRRAVTDALAAICAAPAPASLPFPWPGVVADPEFAAAAAAHASWEWRFGRTPPFTFTLGPGPVPELRQAVFSVQAGRIVAAEVSVARRYQDLIPALREALHGKPFGATPLAQAVAALAGTRPDRAAELRQLADWFAAGLRSAPAP